MSIFFYNILHQKMYELLSLSYINILINMDDMLSADIFIYNITSDSSNDENISVILKHYQKENVIILLDETTEYKIPSLFEFNNNEITCYNQHDDNWFVPIVNKIKEKIINKEYYYYKYL